MNIEHVPAAVSASKYDEHYVVNSKGKRLFEIRVCPVNNGTSVDIVPLEGGKVEQVIAFNSHSSTHVDLPADACFGCVVVSYPKEVQS